MQMDYIQVNLIYVTQMCLVDSLLNTEQIKIWLNSKQKKTYFLHFEISRKYKIKWISMSSCACNWQN